MKTPTHISTSPHSHTSFCAEYYIITKVCVTQKFKEINDRKCISHGKIWKWENCELIISRIRTSAGDTFKFIIIICMALGKLCSFEWMQEQNWLHLKWLSTYIRYVVLHVQHIHKAYYALLIAQAHRRIVCVMK